MFVARDISSRSYNPELNATASTALHEIKSAFKSKVFKHCVGIQFLASGKMGTAN